ncbi:MAG TPA: helix-turn-helix transcriptional regulator [Nitrososphaera sp.]|nr:helix-turn-helix transcriptional regulator [Nitrososphaera sp.]
MTVKKIDTSWLAKEICTAIRERRLALCITQDELSRRSGLHRTYLSDIERGSRNISLRNLQRLAEALEMSPSNLIISAEQANMKAVRKAQD